MLNISGGSGSVFGFFLFGFHFLILFLWRDNIDVSFWQVNCALSAYNS